MSFFVFILDFTFSWCHHNNNLVSIQILTILFTGKGWVVGHQRQRGLNRSLVSTEKYFYSIWKVSLYLISLSQTTFFQLIQTMYMVPWKDWIAQFCQRYKIKQCQWWLILIFFSLVLSFFLIGSGCNCFQCHLLNAIFESLLHTT